MRNSSGRPEFKIEWLRTESAGRLNLLPVPSRTCSLARPSRQFTSTV